MSVTEGHDVYLMENIFSEVTHPNASTTPQDIIQTFCFLNIYFVFLRKTCFEKSAQKMKFLGCLDQVGNPSGPDHGPWCVGIPKAYPF
jgi:hypothetical protein